MGNTIRRIRLKRLADQGDEEALRKLNKLKEDIRVHNRTQHARRKAKRDEGDPKAIAAYEKKARQNKASACKRKAEASELETIAAREKARAYNRAYKRRKKAEAMIIDQKERAKYEELMSTQLNDGSLSKRGAEVHASNTSTHLKTSPWGKECRIYNVDDAKSSEHSIDIASEVNSEGIADARAESFEGRVEENAPIKAVTEYDAIDLCSDDEEDEVMVKQERIDSNQSHEESEYLRPIKEEHPDEADTAAWMNSEVIETLDQNEVEKQPAMHRANEAPVKHEVIDLSETDERVETELGRAIRSQSKVVTGGSSLEEAELKLELEKLALQKKEVDIKLRLLRVQNTERGRSEK